MSNWAEPGSDAWLEALDYPSEERAEVQANRRRQLAADAQLRRANTEMEPEQTAGLARRGSKNWIEALDHPPENRAWVTEHRLQMLEAEKHQQWPKQKENRDWAKEKAEFKEMMMAKRAAKLAASAAEEEIAAQQESDAPPPPTGYVYFVRNGELFKIGITENMLRRLRELVPDELLNVVRCSNFQEVERELHRRFKDVRLPQTEYFRLSDQQVQEAHQLMVKLAKFSS